MPIFIKTLTGKILNVDVGPKETIGNLKKKIRKIEGLEESRQSLIFDGKILNLDSATLEDLGIMSQDLGSTLYLVTKSLNTSSESTVSSSVGDLFSSSSNTNLTSDSLTASSASTISSQKSASDKKWFMEDIVNSKFTIHQIWMQGEDQIAR